jgi:hypothetical protein
VEEEGASQACDAIVAVACDVEPGAGVDERGVPALQHAAGVPQAAAQRGERVSLGVGPRQREDERQRQRPCSRRHAWWWCGRIWNERHRKRWKVSSRADGAEQQL